MKERNKKYLIPTFIFILGFIAIFLRFWRLSYPQEAVFDEVYYPKWAQEFLQGQIPYDVHPPMTKLLIAFSEIIFGNTFFGWRFMPALMGSLIIFITYFLTLKIFKDKIIAFISAFLVAFDGLFFVLSRIGIMEMFTVFFAVLSLFLFWQALESEKKIFWLFLTGITTGLAISSKWTNLAIWLIIIIWSFYYRRVLIVDKKINIFNFLLCIAVIPIVIYIVGFIIWRHGLNNIIQELINWHKSAFLFHLNLTSIHPYSSKWWSWPFLARPVWYYFQQVNNLTYGIIALGNPFIWWGGIIAVFWASWEFFKLKTKNPAILFCLLGLIFTYLPWVFIKRVQFNYYYLTSLFFVILLLSYFLKQCLNKYKYYVIIYLVLVFFSFLFFYPILADIPMSESFYRLHIWFKSWI